MTKKILAAAALSAAAVSANAQDLLVNIHSSGAMAQGAGLVLATQATQQDASVRVLLCDEAAQIALKGAETPTLKPMDATPQQMLQGLIKAGAKIEVCALFLPNTGKKPEDLVSGVSVGVPADVAKYMLQPNVKILSF